MGDTVDMAEESDSVPEMRDALTDRLVADGLITSPIVERAFRRVPRHEFVPVDTPLRVAYNAEDSVPVKRDEHGVIISSISAPFIQARMIEQAGLRPGMSVLEIGSGGYNAALLAEVVGPDGRVVSVDIDAEVTDQARASLEAAGYDGKVTVTLVDGEVGAPEFAPFDAIIVTVGAWDIPSAWWEQLTADGVLVVPLRMNGITRAIGFRRDGDHLVSTSAEVCGFVAMQGVGAYDERAFRLPDRNSRAVTLRFDTGSPDHPDLLDGVLATERIEAWAGVTVEHGVSFADLHLWLAGFLPGFCRVAAEEGTELAEEAMGKGWFPYGTVLGDSFAYLAVRPAPEGIDGVEFGGRAYGLHGEQPARMLVEQIQAWDRQARNAPAPTFAFWPTGSIPPDLPTGTARFIKTHGTVTVSWPTAV